jgi:hypothetical protein
MMLLYSGCKKNLIDKNEKNYLQFLHLIGLNLSRLYLKNVKFAESWKSIENISATGSFLFFG